jgi:uncharacterized OB-fold protein
VNLAATEGDAGVTTSWRVEGVRRHEDERRRRCLACGVRIVPPVASGEEPRCARCRGVGRPVDRLMSWIWQDLDRKH